ncbi:dockerin type I domain-containing protein [Stieleria varia]|uniref:Dockerin type I repeat protein n=1 Tax=Stieleria varia TaxID=2528005 RepID=A0A5C6A2U4_9BACT|nr:dockerin type I domain-containing protein [Stieleria varia]TWT92723.1 Dockerin type I repeat protein [Stieleria varia]
MIQKRKHLLESLETRQLLAAECFAIPNELLSAGDQVIAGDLSASVAAAQSGQVTSWNAAGLPIDQSAIALIRPYYHADLIQEVDGRLIAVDTSDNTLHVFSRSNDGGLEQIGSVSVAGGIHDMRVVGNQVLLFSPVDLPIAYPTDAMIAPPWGTETLVTTVNLGDEITTIRQTLPGSYNALDVTGNRVVIRQREGGGFIPAIWPPPEMPPSSLNVYDITENGLQLVDSVEVPHYGDIQVRGDDIFVAETVHPEIEILPPIVNYELGIDAAGNVIPPDEFVPSEPPVEFVPTKVVLTRMRISDQSIEQVAQWESAEGELSSLYVSEDATTATMVQTQYLGIGAQLQVSLLDLSANSISVFDSFSVQASEPTGVMSVIDIGPGYVVLHDFDQRELTIVSTDQSIDIASENRVRTLSLPEGWQATHQTLRRGTDRLVVGALVRRTSQPSDPTRPNATNDIFHELRSGFLTVKLSSAEIIADTVLPAEIHSYPGSLIPIDPVAGRFGFISGAEAVNTSRIRLIVGRLNDAGEFVVSGSVALPNTYTEIDANPQRLLVRYQDRLLEYDWGNLTEPTTIPLGELLPAIQAVDDALTIDFSGQPSVQLDVTANDDLGSGFAPAQIVELIGAPRGAEIEAGRFVRIPATALRNSESLRFEYVISDGLTRSRAVAEVTVNTIDESLFQDLIDSILRRAASDFGVSVNEVEVTSLERFVGEPLPYVPPDDPNNPIDLSPGVLMLVNTPGNSALYAGSIDGRIIQVFGSTREFLVELGLRAVDANGQPVTEVAVGDEFWLEFRADDLRPNGGGVFSAFFDLAVPADLLQLTGQVEYGDGFSRVANFVITDSEVDELGAIGNQVQPPGNEVQTLLRIGARALAAGDVQLQLDPADNPVAETTMHGIDDAIDLDRVRLGSLELTIVESEGTDPLDVDGNGSVTAGDALMVVNFIGQHGVLTLNDIVATGAEGEQVSQTDLESMRRMDTNRNGSISALDALFIINRLREVRLAELNAEQLSSESVTPQPLSSIVSADAMDDDDDVAGETVNTDLF